MSKTVHTTGPDHRNQGAGHPTAPNLDPAKPGYGSASQSSADALNTRESQNFPAAGDAEIARGYGKDASYRGDEDLAEEGVEMTGEGAPGAPGPIGEAGTAMKVMQAQGADAGRSPEVAGSGRGDSDRLGTGSNSPGAQAGSSAGGSGLGGHTSAGAQMGGTGGGRSGDIGATATGGRSESVGTSGLGARSGATTRVDLTQADSENVGDTWMEAEERAPAGATRGRR
jgi:hypothetical protein